jgi:hypothetical protein
MQLKPLIRDLAADKAKRELFTRLALHFATLASEAQPRSPCQSGRARVGLFRGTSASKFHAASDSRILRAH